MTAVQWLQNKLNNVRPTQICSIETIKEWVEQAKQMEETDLEHAYDQGHQDGYSEGYNEGYDEGVRDTENKD